MAEKDGHINDEIIKVYEELAQGEVGLILTGYAFISKDEQPNPRMLGIYDDSFIEEYKVLVDKVHQHGSKIALQIVFGGSQSHHPNVNEMNILGPSQVENRVTEITPREATKLEIESIVKKFGDAAVRAKKSGFDAVQIHAAHGYFLSQFLTPYYNRRNDEYGGNIHNRARIIYEVIEEVRKRVGDEYPIMIKLNFDDFMDEGEGLIEAEAMEVFKTVDKLGVDIIEVSAVNESSGKGMAPARTSIKSLNKQSYFREVTAKIAREVSAKVILMGGNRNINLMHEILNTTNIEYFSIARPLLCEPDLINKWIKNIDYIPKCISCNKCWETEPNKCILNRI
ncbi:2,4-dienoyl-CoA reductase-like NADH-dependent reductase (Old Yellow Enzyme family) [Clostridium algifaecis]|uniref:2,4-dienoyl-CoA reductase-like NADH-dependent reductase (Old Yellow Enzyme family) n=2 Tax=Clostridium algifaecis TaxID=1472040 RepID=A0ABS4KTS8_9CLOT|nr:2,4-dienoyl-CoA reductase-like NADH-dependent reductase (Old Yellow Enzyme family) [Clostridium algifaecis]